MSSMGGVWIFSGIAQFVLHIMRLTYRKKFVQQVVIKIQRIGETLNLRDKFYSKES